MAVKVTVDGAGRVWVTSTLDGDRGPAVRFTVEEAADFVARVKAGEYDWLTEQESRLMGDG